MQLVFVCPQTGQSFNSKNYAILDNQGVAFDENGRKTLNARVQMTEPCPFCGRIHVYQADELACPLNGKSTK